MLFGGFSFLFVTGLAAPSVVAPPAPPSTASLAAQGRPASHPGTWVTTGDYPAIAMRERREGATGFRLTYDASGVPQKCDIISSSGHAVLDARTCELVMIRARFEPGRDAAGRALGGTYSNRVRWSLSETGPDMGEPFPFAESGNMALDYLVDATGAVARCDVRIHGLVGEGADQSDVGDPCVEIRAAAPYPPPHDRDGKPVARRYRMTMDVIVEDIGAEDTPPK